MLTRIKEQATTILAITAILGTVGYIVKPHAETFIRDTTQDTVSQLNVRLHNVERQMREQTTSTNTANEQLKELIKQQKKLLKALQNNQ